jgi:hypothetical protein
MQPQVNFEDAESEVLRCNRASFHPVHRIGIAYRHWLDKLTGFTNLRGDESILWEVFGRLANETRYNAFRRT